jgi:hypothetical protein
MRKRPNVQLYRPIIAGKLTNLEGDEPIVKGIRNQHVTEALNAAKQTDLAAFRGSVMEKLTPTVPALANAINGIIELSQQKVGHEDAMRAFVGSLLGGSVLLRLSEERVVVLSECQHNLLDYGVNSGGIQYDGQDIEPSQLVRIFGSDAAEGMQAIPNAAARTACAATLGLSIIPMS